jgi:hypothetical protein
MTNYYLRSTDGLDSDNGTTWALAKATAAGVAAIPWTNADTVFVSQVHAESQAGALTITGPTSPGLRILCGNDGAEPPTALASTGKFSATGNVQININGFIYFNGLTFDCGSAGGSGSNIVVAQASNPAHLIFDNCQFYQHVSGGAPSLLLGPGAGGSLDDVQIDIIGGSLATFRFTDTGETIFCRHGRINLKGVTIDSAGVAPTTLFKFAAGAVAVVVVEASDLTGKTWTNLVDVSAACPSQIDFIGCKVPSSFTPTTGTIPGPGGVVVRMHRCNNGDVQSYFYETRYEGSCEYSSAIYRTAGVADDDGTHFSAKMISSANVKFWDPLRSIPFAIPITAVGSSKTVTAYVAVDASAPTLTNANVWMEITAYTTSGVPLGVIASSRVSDILASTTNLTTSSEGWTGLGGTNAKFEIALPFMPQEKGSYVGRICIAEASRTLYADLDPLVA